MGSTVGIMYFGGQMAGTIAPTLIGYTITLFNGSYNGAFTLLIASLCISIIASFFLKFNSAQQKSLGGKLRDRYSKNYRFN